MIPQPFVDINNLRRVFDVSKPWLNRVLEGGELEFLKAVDGVTFDIAKGETFALVGESGSGKTTVARMVVGLLPPSSGEVIIDGVSMSDPKQAQARRKLRKRIQMIFQDPYSSLNPRLTVGGILRELLRVHHVVPRDQVESRARELLRLVGLDEDAAQAYPRQFSGGQRQRVAIARAIALAPELLVADEPVSALDVSVQATILNLLQDLRADLGLTLLLISHNLAVVRHLCDRVAVMYLGRIIEVAPTEALFSNPRHPYTAGLLAAIPRMTPGDEDEPPAVQGDPPSPLRLPTGCRFRTRCPIAQPVCAERDPALTSADTDPEHSAACHFAWTTETANAPEAV